MSQESLSLQQQIDEIKARNRRVEADKKRETSRARKIIIAVLTYAVIVLFFYFAELPKPFVNSIVPTLGFLLSTLGLGLFKNLWIKHRRK